MKSKKLLISILVLFVFLININVEVEATQGKLKSATICKGSDGNYYGQHSSDNHWHAAVEHTNGWYALGNPLGYNPCSSNSSSSSSVSSSSNSNTSSSANNSNKVNNSSQVKKETSKVYEKTNNKPSISGLDSKDIVSKEGKIISSKDIVELFKIEVKDKEDGKIDFDNYLVTPSEINLNEIGFHYITIYYKDSDRNVVEKELKLEVQKESFFDKLFS